MFETLPKRKHSTHIDNDCVLVQAAPHAACVGPTLRPVNLVLGEQTHVVACAPALCVFGCVLLVGRGLVWCGVRWCGGHLLGQWASRTEASTNAAAFAPGTAMITDGDTTQHDMACTQQHTCPRRLAAATAPVVPPLT